MKKAAIVLCIIFAVLLLLFLLCPLLNNAFAEKTADTLEAIPLPETTEVTEKISRAGKLTGNGNGMQYFGALLLRSELTLEELQAYYTGVGADCTVTAQETQQIEAIENTEVLLSTDVTAGGFYLVYTWRQTGFPLALFDLRGN